jgi:hypothetical protein
MWPTRITFAQWWHRVIRVGFVAVVVCASACSGPGGAGSTPATRSPDGGQAGAVGSRNGGDGY